MLLNVPFTQVTPMYISVGVVIRIKDSTYPKISESTDSTIVQIVPIAIVQTTEKYRYVSFSINERLLEIYLVRNYKIVEQILHTYLLFSLACSLHRWSFHFFVAP
jgi:hypothetical protein